ncbi:Na+/H+ antiporter NhaC family protein [Veronia pacifica]|uniref:Na+/H+ antiporter n=1 Tax=Veronia pacifica TaxID=1080227 RepID=A0A1C3ES15_9GAMM|nr:Na+/H+ antiporter NhaC family protein [Veronia pacifica]ODA35978.1 Na+/H+ antiporter [Veronia pacifica]
MNLIDFSSSALSILPAILALGLAILTRHVLLSLGVGIVSGALLLNDFSLFGSLSYIADKAKGIVIDGTSINSHNMSIIAFLILLGMTTALLTLSGGTRAFAEWAQQRVKSKRGAKLLAAFLGVFIFIDDYFNSLAVGAISRPVTDRFYVSRTKLAYILDTTAAPMCVLMPASSWGAYIITVIGGILISHGVTEYSPLSAFAAMLPMNFYAIFALLMVFAVVWFQLDIGSMRRFEYQACLGNKEDEDETQTRSLDEDLGIIESSRGTITDLILPIVVLILSTFGMMMYTGAAALASEGKPFSMLGAFEFTNVSQSLLTGGLIGFASALLMVLRQGLAVADIVKTLSAGAQSMFGAILILTFAWAIGGVIGDMATGSYLSSLIQGSLPVQVLPAVLFLLAALMAFSTGTSWGTFGIMLPIAGDMAAAADISLMLPMLSAVLAGAVFGDHCSPISDTTILSSTGARCNHIDHVTTQLPYALAVAFISCIGYLILGTVGSVFIALVASFGVFCLMCIYFSWLSKRPGRLC